MSRVGESGDERGESVPIKFWAITVTICLSCLLPLKLAIADEARTSPTEAPEMGEAFLPHSLSFESVEPESYISADIIEGAFPQSENRQYTSAQTVPGSPSLGEYFSKKEVRDISLSPDGRHVAVIKRTTKDDHAIFILDLAQNGKVIKAISEPSSILFSNITWLAPGRMGITMARPGFFFIERNVVLVFFTQRLLAIDVDGSNPVVMLDKDKKFETNLFLAGISSYLPNDPEHIQMLGFDRSVNLYKVNIRTGEGELVVKGGKRTYAFQTDIDGTPRMRADFYDKPPSIKIYRYELERNRWKKVARIKLDAGSEEISEQLVALTGQDEYSIIARKDGDEFAKLHRYNILTNEFTETLYGVDGYDLRETVSDGWSGEPIGVSYIKDRPKYVFFNPDLQKVQTNLEEYFPNGTAQLLRITNDGNRFLLFIDEPWRAGTFYVFDKMENSLRPIVDVNPVINRHKLTAVDLLEYKTADGTKISGYLTFPHGRQDVQLPLIVFPHGGPFTRDWLTFDVVVQYWASRGYAVFQPNFRGSSGFGRTFEEAGYKEYGGLMIDDIDAGVKALIKSGRVDPKRICAAGFSYGGYASLMLPIKSDLYACAVSINGVSDLAYQFGRDTKGLKDKKIRQEFAAWVEERVGNARTEQKMLEEQSPLHRYREISAPLLLVAAADDKTVFVENSRQLNKLLEEAGMSVEYYEYEKGGHSLRADGKLKLMLQTTERFFLQHIGPLLNEPLALKP